jgi:hypothetical protein
MQRGYYEIIAQNSSPTLRKKSIRMPFPKTGCCVGLILRSPVPKGNLSL